MVDASAGRGCGSTRSGTRQGWSPTADVNGDYAEAIAHLTMNSHRAFARRVEWNPECCRAIRGCGRGSDTQNPQFECSDSRVYDRVSVAYGCGRRTVIAPEVGYEFA